MHPSPAFPGASYQHPTGQTLITLYVKLHTARSDELYVTEGFYSEASPERIEEIFRAEGGTILGEETHGDFQYLQTSSHEFSIYSYTFTGPEGYIDYDIGWVEELITKAEEA